MKIFVITLFLLSFFLVFNSPVKAIVDPLSVPNNKFGIHIIQATPDESSPAAQLVNTNGDWGYITFLIESKDRNESKWQEFFNDLRRKHLIPIVRLATKPVNTHWERPYEKEGEAWAHFLDKLVWPTKNRYIIIYNEPNHAQEWGNFTDPISYAHILNDTIDTLKKKSPDFYVLNAGFDASAPHQPPRFFDEVVFLQEMEKAVPGIFEKLDGWVSHSYPNPEFSGSPDALGRGTVRTYVWELQQLRNLGVSKNLPVFITETGWKHAEGLTFEPRFPAADTVARYYQQAFENAWNSSRIIAVTPFLLSYQEPLFAHFSFKGPTNSGLYYPQYDTIKNMPKISGQPIQENKATLIKGEVFSSIVSGETYTIFLTFKNSGQSIWNDGSPRSSPRGEAGAGGAGKRVALVPIESGRELGIEQISIPDGVQIEPGKEYTFQIQLKAPLKGIFKVSLNLFTGSHPFDSKPPVILRLLTKLKWRNSPAGEYILRTIGTIGESTQL